MAFREQSVEDYSDLFADNDGVFNQKLSLKKVCSFYGLIYLACVVGLTAGTAARCPPTVSPFGSH